MNNRLCLISIQYKYACIIHVSGKKFMPIYHANASSKHFTIDTLCAVSWMCAYKFIFIALNWWNIYVYALNLYFS